MKLLLNKNVEGSNRMTKETRLHGKPGDVLFVLLESPSYYICDSFYYENQAVIVFKTQVKEIIKDDISKSEEQAVTDEFTVSGDHLIRDFREIIEEESDSPRYRDKWRTSSY